MSRSLTARALGLACAVCAAAALVALPAVASAAESSQQEACPNAAVRTGPSLRLPECRAYEMVTPVYKEGFRVEIEEDSTGLTLAGQSLGLFAGVENSLLGYDAGSSSVGASYTFSRGPSGWTTTVIEPPASAYPYSIPLGLSSDGATSLWYALTPSQVEHIAFKARVPAQLYIRESNGLLSEIGPLEPPAVGVGSIENEYVSYLAASSDLSHVVYSLREGRWPGDSTPTGAESIYEYVGTGNSHPLLVGVSGGFGSTALISQCETEAGSYDKHASGRSNLGNAISESGSTIYFTAAACGSSPAVEELYARVDGEAADAHTVAISEPSSEDCEACDTGAAVRAPAVFQAASADGSKVFFATKQPLLGGDSSQNIYEYDFDGPVGHRVVRVSGGDATVSDPTANASVVRISGDGSHVYFLAKGVLTRAPNSQGQTAQPGASNLYLFERDAQYPSGRTVFIATTEIGESTLSLNGRFLVFTSPEELTPDDTSAPGAPQAFEYDAQTGSLVRISVGQNGYADDGNGSHPRVNEAPGSTGRPGTAVSGLMVADDGAAFFTSPDPLTPQASTEAVYEYREGSVYLISSGDDPSGVTLDFVTPSGSDVFFQTRDQLVPRDTDTAEDTYDARVDGGFAEPAPPPPCSADACQGELSAAPVLLSPGSEFQAGGNPPLASQPAAQPKAAKAKKQKQKRRKAHRRKRPRKASRARRATDRRGGRS